MFFKKKATPAPAPAEPINTGMLFTKLGSELYRAVGKTDGSSSVSAVLEFDAQQRIANVQNLTVDGAAKVLPFAVIEAMNVVAQPMAELPENQKLKSLKITIDAGRIGSQAEYVLN